MSSSSGPTPFVEGHRHAVVTPDNVGPIIHIVTWFLMVVMILATFLRLMIRFTTIHVPGADDAVISIALLFGIGEVVAISLAVNAGLGTELVIARHRTFDNIAKAVYAADILYILTIALAKSSTLLLIDRLANVKLHKVTVQVLGVIIVLWTLAAVFGQAFQCSLPNPWQTVMADCFDIVSFWDAIGSIDIILDVALIALPAHIIWGLHMHWSRRLVVTSGFVFRLVLCACQITRLVYLVRIPNSPNYIRETMNYTIATQCQTTLAVVAACIPALKPFMDRAASGLLAASLEERAGTYDASGGSRTNPDGRKNEMAPLDNMGSNEVQEPPTPSRWTGEASLFSYWRRSRLLGGEPASPVGQQEVRQSASEAGPGYPIFGGGSQRPDGLDNDNGDLMIEKMTG